MKTPIRLTLIAAALALVSPLSASDVLTVSVSSAAAKNYRRVKQADGSYQPENYVIANGGQFPGTTRDESFDRITYPQVAGIVAQHLAAQNYFLAPKVRDATLLIAIYWGETIPFNDTNYDRAVNNAAVAINNYQASRPSQPSLAARINGNSALKSGADAGGDVGAVEFSMAQVEMENRQRDMSNLDNAKLLGYVDAINERREIPPWADVAGLVREMESDVEESRYYVVVAAYDFTAMKERNRKELRWVTRISVGSQGNAFNERIAQMVASAADSFGQRGGLRRRHFGDAKVILGETKFHGEATAADLKKDGPPAETK